jgi:hypothetical protein
VTNTVYHTAVDGVFDPCVDAQNHAQEVLDVFTGNSANYPQVDHYVHLSVSAIVYNMADPEPRPELARATYTPSAPLALSQLAPQQVALCCSYYGARNLPSERGRIYIGGWTAGQVGRPSGAFMSKTADLGHALFDVGGEDIAWVIYSQKHKTSEPITTVWCDDSWDTQRRRKLEATSRVTVKP